MSIHLSRSVSDEVMEENEINRNGTNERAAYENDHEPGSFVENFSVPLLKKNRRRKKSKKKSKKKRRI